MSGSEQQNTVGPVLGLRRGVRMGLLTRNDIASKRWICT